MCFGGGADRGDVEGANKSREIDKQIRQEEKKMAREVKLLLLGKHRALETVTSLEAFRDLS
jgi:guanine nucleotide-binding protein subunit alpha